MKNKYFVRVSIGSLAVLGCIDLRIKYFPTTLYMLQYSETGCLGKCLYCAQSILSNISKKFLSRITWYPVDLDIVIEKLKKQFTIKRICIQSILKHGFPQELISIIKYLRNNDIDLPISVSINPVHEEIIKELKKLGVDYIGIGLDTVTPSLFKKYGKPGSWNTYWRFFEKTLEIMGYRKVFIHLIIGLGEKPYELYQLMEKIIDLGGDIALFPYIDISSRKFRVETDLEYYRSAQIIRYFLLKGYKLDELIEDNRVKPSILKKLINNIDRYITVFYTSGCPYCNRPYYTESPRGPYYNIYSDKHYREYRGQLSEELEKMVEE